MSAILTIDWDYFFNVDLNTRDFDFPQITDGRVKSIPDNKVWLEDEIYKAPQSFDNKSFIRLIQTLEKVSIQAAFVSENHGEMFNVVTDYIRGEYKDTTSLEIVNIDYHHDYSYNNGENLCCDNWARLLTEKYPGTTIKWCKKEDSVITSFGCHVPVEKRTFNEVIKSLSVNHFDYIHLCRSDLYSPPLRDKKFDLLMDIIADAASMEEPLKMDHIINPRKEYFEYRKLFKEVNNK